MGSWTLLHPWLLAGLAAAALPILIHLIGRKRAPHVRFAAFDFLVAVNKRLARRERLRQILLLLMRTLAIIMLVLAVARPMPPRPAAAAPEHRHLALVLDASGSMAYERDGQTLLERAKKMANEAISHLQPGDSAVIAVAGEAVRTPLQAPSLDSGQLRRAIDEVESPSGTADLGAAIEQALALFGDDAAGAQVVVISDLSRNSFARLHPLSLDPPPEVVLLDAAEREEPAALPNVGLETVSIERSGAAAQERLVKVVVRNWGNEEVLERPLELSIEGRITQRALVDVPANGSAEKTLAQSFDGAGVFSADLRLGDDPEEGYEPDDRLRFAVAVEAPVEVMAVNGDPRTVPYEDELFFVERALDTIRKGDAPIRLRIVTVDELESRDEPYDYSLLDVVILANVVDLPASEIEALTRYVRAGGALLVSLGERVDFERANESLGELLAHPLRATHLAADPDAGTAPLGIGKIDWAHPILRGLGQAAEESLRASRTKKYFNLDIGAGRKARAILRFDNGAPALVERALGEGRLMLLATTVDVDWSDLALRTSFPPLLQRSVRYLAGTVEGAAQARTRLGAEVELPVPTGASAVALTSPSGERLEATPDDTEAHRVSFPPLQETGIYHAQIAREGWQDAPQLDVAVNASLSESDFAPVRPTEIAAALAGEASESRINVSVGDSAAQDPFAARGAAPFLLLAFALLFVSESLLAARG